MIARTCVSEQRTVTTTSMPTTCNMHRAICAYICEFVVVDVDGQEILVQHFDLALTASFAHSVPQHFDSLWVTIAAKYLARPAVRLHQRTELDRLVARRGACVDHIAIQTGPTVDQHLRRKARRFVLDDPMITLRHLVLRQLGAVWKRVQAPHEVVSPERVAKVPEERCLCIVDGHLKLVHSHIQRKLRLQPPQRLAGCLHNIRWQPCFQLSFMLLHKSLHRATALLHKTPICIISNAECTRADKMTMAPITGTSIFPLPRSSS